MSRCWAPARSGEPHLILKLSPVYRFVLIVALLGVAVLFVVVARGDVPGHLSLEAVVFSLFVVLGELLPITVPRSGEQDEITTSTTFSLALLVIGGPAAAMVAQAVGSVVSDVVRRKPTWKALFNVGQYCLSLGVAAATFSLISAVDPGSSTHFSMDTIPPLLAAGTAFFVTNTSVTGVALALAQGVPVRGYLWGDLVAQVRTDGVLIVLTPIVLLTAQESLWLVPLIVVPMVAVYKSASISLENAALVRRLEDSLTDLRELNRINEHQALHDSLTGLPNRTLFMDRVTQAVRSAQREGHLAAVLVIDLDRFKDINDTLGHHDGDLVLEEIGWRLRSALRESDTIARVGGDEFAVLVPAADDRAGPLKVAERIRHSLEAPIEVEGLTLHVEASIGVSLYPDHGRDADTLLQRADLAMYVAKSGNAGLQVYAARYDRLSRRRLALLGELRRAIDDGQLILHYQPKVELETGRLVGLEALLRWQHPSRTLIPPDEFIPIAENTGLIGPLTLYVLEAALRQGAAWKLAERGLTMAINLSARNVMDVQLPGNIGRLLERFEMPPSALELEITESALLGQPAQAMTVLNAVSEMGVTLSLDDFGTGYSSLASLKRLPVHEIKIDRSFVMNMATVDSDAAIVRSTVDLGHNLGLRVVAEGVESEEIWNRLTLLGCDVAQGFFLSRPLPAADMTAWMREWDRRQAGASDASTFSDGGVTKASTTWSSPRSA